MYEILNLNKLEKRACVASTEQKRGLTSIEAFAQPFNQPGRADARRLSCTLGLNAEPSMISKEREPVEWAMLMYELDDAREHLESMMASMTTDPEYDEAVFRIDLGHIFAHLNRAWRRRNFVGELEGQALADASRFPTDLEPI